MSKYERVMATFQHQETDRLPLYDLMLSDACIEFFTGRYPPIGPEGGRLQSRTVNAMLDMARSKGAKVVLLATPKPSLAGAVFNSLSPPEFYAEIAKDKKVPLIDEAIPKVLSDTNLKGDQIHPNAAGHAKLGELIHADLKKIGFAG